jgi:hypothetical protein
MYVGLGALERTYAREADAFCGILSYIHLALAIASAFTDGFYVVCEGFCGVTLEGEPACYALLVRNQQVVLPFSFLRSLHECLSRLAYIHVIRIPSLLCVPLRMLLAHTRDRQMLA